VFKSILVPVDLAHESSWQFAIPEAIELAKAGQRKLTVMTVVREPKVMFEGVYLSFQLDQMVAEARSNLDKIVRKFHMTEMPIEQDVRFGSIGHEVLAAARDRGVDLIVMASHRPEMLDYLIGPNAAHVARHAACSVLILRRFSKN
jgi:nucleotide-binding universal stress UspA family protein